MDEGPRRADAVAGGDSATRSERHRSDRPNRHEGENGGKPRRDKRRGSDPRGEREDLAGSKKSRKFDKPQRRSETEAERPRREAKPFDPDSPFAALAVLKERQDK